MGQYLVTGGAGFIGSHLCEALLKQGDTPIVLDNLSTGKIPNLPTNASLIVGDIRDEDVVQKSIENADGVFHLAAVASVQKCHGDWKDCHSVNSMGTVNVFEKAARRSLPVVYASSAAVYGASKKLGLSEQDDEAPISAYGLDKYFNEKQAEIMGQVNGLRSCGLRFFNVFGPRQDPSSPYSGVISIFVERFLKQRGITVFGDGQQTRDFIFVGDVVRALMSAMRKTSSSAPRVNACTGKSTSLLNLISTLSSITGHKPVLTYEAARIGDIRHSLGDPTLLHEMLGLKSRISLKEGLLEILYEAALFEARQKEIV